MKGFEQYKLCTGPSHERPTRLPLDEQHFYFHRTGPNAGEPTARCRVCHNWKKLLGKDGPHGYVSVSDELRAYTKELIERCGPWYGPRQYGLRPETLRAMVAGEHRRVQRRTALRILSALSDQRKADRINGASPRFVEAKREVADREQRIERHGGY
jgi:hypothetical protein